MQYETLCPAKINLFLHILGKRADGYHILESLVTFADYGDRLSFVPSDKKLSLNIIGQYANELNGHNLAENLIIKAAKQFESKFGIQVLGRFTLDKKLPVASGIGGGSSNAAMALKLLMQAYGKTQNIDEILLKLGADVPVCYAGINTIMAGIGEILQPWHNMPKLHAILINPNVGVSTGKIFSALDVKPEIADYEFIDATMPVFETLNDVVAFLKHQRNDMQSAAIDICPQIGNVLDALNACDEVEFAQMSGSGATCFGVFSTAEQAEIAAQKLRISNPNWWVQPTILAV